MVMKRRVFSSVALIACAALVWGVLAGVAWRHSPRIHVASEQIDLGTIDGAHPDPNRPDRVEFEIANRGSGVLKLTRVHVGCPCLEPYLERSSLGPGETTKLSIRVSVPTAVGQFHERVFLYSNDARHPVKELRVKGYVHRACYVLPESISVMGLRMGEDRAVELEVTGPDGDNAFDIRGVSAANKEVVVHGVEKSATAGLSSKLAWRIRLTVGSRGLDSWEDGIVVSTSSREMPVIEVPLKVQELSPVRIEPAAVVLKAQTDGTIPEAMVQVSANTDTPIEIVSIDKPDWVDVRAEPGEPCTPTQLSLTVNDKFSRMKSVVGARIGLILGKERRRVEIPLLVVSSDMSRDLGGGHLDGNAASTLHGDNNDGAPDSRRDL